MTASLPPAWLPDPMTAVYRRMRTGLLDCPAFAPIVKPADFPDLADKKFQKIPEELIPGRMPELIVAQSDFKLQPYGPNSLVASIVQGYDFIATVDKLQVTPINSVKWAVFVGLFGLGLDLSLPGLVSDWFIRDGVDDPFGQPEWKRGTERYVSMLRVSVAMNIPRALLAAIALPSP